MMGFGDMIFWPFALAFGGAMIIVGIALIAFWIWMLVDCAKRRFRKDSEKIIWIILIVIFGWIGSLVYLIVIKYLNHNGLMRK